MHNETLDSYFAAVNSENWDLMAQLWTDDARLDAVGFEPIFGKDEILAYYPKILASYPQHLDTPTRTISSGSTHVVEIHFTGRIDTGAAIEFDAIDVFDLDGAKINRLSTWYDSKRVARMVKPH
ncbi:nuclear transport factor 2 family protein [Rhodococcus koreensis]